MIYEMSRAAVEAARERIAGQPYADRIELRCTDVLSDNIPDAVFDLVYIQAAIHHFFNIEEMYALIHRVLKPDGLLIFDEFIGPDHHQYPPDLMKIMDEINACLNERYRHDVLSDTLRKTGPRSSLEWMLRHDPSEGVHATRIMPLTHQYFDVVERIGMGGTIMRPFFCGILRNFDFADPRDQTIARLIILLEQTLIRHGVIPHYHAEVIARRRAVPRAPLTEKQIGRMGYSDWDPAVLEQPDGPEVSPGPRTATVLAAMTAKCEDYESRLASTQRHLDNVLNSTTWRATGIMRGLAGKLPNGLRAFVRRFSGLH